MQHGAYKIYRIPKRSGGFRIIEAPDDDLKDLQRRDLPRLRQAFKVSPFCHAFTGYKNIVTNAESVIAKQLGACSVIMWSELSNKYAGYIRGRLIVRNASYNIDCPALVEGVPIGDWILKGR